MSNEYDDAGNIVSAPGDKTRSAKRAKNKSKRAQMKGWEADLSVLGNPVIQSKATATLKKCGGVLDGDWRISGVKHEISGSGYICTLKLVRPDAKAAADNTTTAVSPDSTAGGGTSGGDAADDEGDIILNVGDGQ